MLSSTQFLKIGGQPAIKELARSFYEKVFKTPALALYFGDNGPQHVEYLGKYLIEALSPGDLNLHPYTRMGRTFQTRRINHQKSWRFAGRRFSIQDGILWQALFFHSAKENPLIWEDSEIMEVLSDYIQDQMTLYIQGSVPRFNKYQLK